MSASKLQISSEVRIGHTLNKHEEDFVRKRKQTVQQCLKKFGIDCPLDGLPKIALLGSGGGERAMLGLLGSLVELDKIGLLDCILYLSGISGSTWCMTSLYEESNWSTNLDSVKQKIIQRLKGPAVTWGDAISKLKKYYYEKDIFSLTDLWAVMIVTSSLNLINEHKVSEQQVGHDKDPLPIYTVTDKGFKQHHDGDPWFEISPHEAGYSLTGAFVDVSKFGCQFQDGCDSKIQPEKDMLYLQALCGSCIADEEYLWEKIRELFEHLFKEFFGERCEDKTPPIEIVYQVLMDVVEMNLLVLKGEDPSHLNDEIRAKLKELTEDTCQLVFQIETGDVKQQMMQYSLDVCDYLRNWFSIWPFDVCCSIIKCMAQWIWGRTYNFLYNMKDDGVPSVLQDSETRDFEDAGMLLNSPYMSVLREKRDVDLIISLDFSEGDPFLTVKTAAEMCRELKIPFPEVDILPVEYPKDFYVFKGHDKVPTVIHIPLFNTVNCGDDIKEWRKRYHTIQFPYSDDMIDPLLDVAGKNITNNKEKLLDEIRACIKKKYFSK
ncbi:cytosolic phospholipase A2 gamma-like [Paramisgurnus dabryanus]|uniref:cytosolic phospholipase A2 gamma-like n=1 Tax=Paramisgurnus dabryanus TaxID=90735 RepID=UPI0031F41EC2